MSAAVGKKVEWSKAYMIRPRDNIISHELIKSKKFIPSYERDPCPPSMSWLIGFEYARIWQKECHEFVTIRLERAKPKRIRNDYKNWIGKRKPKKQRTCIS